MRSHLAELSELYKWGRCSLSQGDVQGSLTPFILASALLFCTSVEDEKPPMCL